MSTNELLEKAILIAAKAHAGQFDKSGTTPYILHPLYVMSLMTSDKARIVAVLHDVLEDTGTSESYLRNEGFPDEIMDALDALNHRKEDDYLDVYIPKVLANELALEVKLGDLTHNMDIKRITDSDRQNPVCIARMQKYKEAYARLIHGKREIKLAAELDTLNLQTEFEYAREGIEYSFTREDYVLYANIMWQIMQNACETYAPRAVIQSRAKRVDSFIEKCYRKDCRKEKRKPLSLDPADRGFTDLCGVRVIVHTRHQVEEICQFVRDNFIIEEENHGDTSCKSVNPEFGYRSIHFVVTLNPDKADILGVDTRLELLRRKKAEIQIRTVLQHSWADILHDRIYKSPAAPLPRHELTAAQLAAMMETGDMLYEQFTDDFDTYSLNTTVNMPIEKVNREISILESMNEMETHQFTALSNALKMTELLRFIGEYDKIRALLKSFIDQAPELKLDEASQACLWYEYGYALFREQEESQAALNSVCEEGISFMDRAIQLFSGLDKDNKGLWLRRKRLYASMLISRGRCESSIFKRKVIFERVLEIDVSNPYALCELTDVNDYGLSAFLIKSAICIAEDHLASEINLPFAYFALGRLCMVAGFNHAGYAYYRSGFWFYANLPGSERKNKRLKGIFRREIQYLDRVKGLRPHIDELSCIAHSLFRHLYETSNVCKSVFVVTDSPDPEPIRAAISELNLSETQLDISDTRKAIDVLSKSVENCCNDLYLYIDTKGPNAETVVMAAVTMGIYVMCVNPALTESLSKDTVPQRLCAVPNERESLLWIMLTPGITVLDDEFVQEAARRAHRAYVEKQSKLLWNTAPNLMEWDRLSETYKNSNILQVKSSADLLTHNGYMLIQAAVKPVGALAYEDLSEDEKVKLAKSEHGRWVSERTKLGWRYARNRDEKNKKNEYIVKWGMLTEEVKGYDTGAIKSLFESFAQGGYYVLYRGTFNDATK